MEKAAESICNSLGCAVLLKGGHQLNDANDLLYQKGQEPVWFRGRRIDNPNTHGTGCTLSSAIASNLAKGHDLTTSVENAKNYIRFIEKQADCHVSMVGVGPDRTQNLMR